MDVNVVALDVVHEALCSTASTKDMLALRSFALKKISRSVPPRTTLTRSLWVVRSERFEATIVRCSARL